MSLNIETKRLYAPLVEKLDRKDRDILEELARGSDFAMIARKCGLQREEVANAVRRIYGQLGIANNPHKSKTDRERAKERWDSYAELHQKPVQAAQPSGMRVTPRMKDRAKIAHMVILDAASDTDEYVQELLRQGYEAAEARVFVKRRP